MRIRRSIYLDGDIVLKKRKEGKTYYFQFWTEDFDIDVYTKWSGKPCIRISDGKGLCTLMKIGAQSLFAQT